MIDRLVSALLRRSINKQSTIESHVGHLLTSTSTASSFPVLLSVKAGRMSFLLLGRPNRKKLGEHVLTSPTEKETGKELGLEAAYNRTALIIKFGPIVSWMFSLSIGPKTKRNLPIDR